MLAEQSQAMKTLRETQRQALVKLLADDDDQVRRLLEDRFIEMGPDGLAFLEWAAAEGTPNDSRRGARRILHAIRERDSCKAFERFCTNAGDHFDLEQACLVLAKTRYPNLDEGPYRIRLDQMARELKERLTGKETPRSTIEVCNRYLFRVLGFRGNAKDYYDKKENYTHKCI